jgi:hypothetical protein
MPDVEKLVKEVRREAKEDRRVLHEKLDRLLGERSDEPLSAEEAMRRGYAEGARRAVEAREEGASRREANRARRGDDNDADD